MSDMDNTKLVYLPVGLLHIYLWDADGPSRRQVREKGRKELDKSFLWAKIYNLYL